MNPMKNIRIEKLTLNVGAGKDQKVLEKGSILLEKVTGITPVKTTTSKRIPGWGLRPGLPIGCKITLRGPKAGEVLKKLLLARDNILAIKQFDLHGNMSFGVPEYIDIPGIEYDPKIGIMGFEVCVTLERPGYRIKKRFSKKKKIGKKHMITKDDAVNFMKENFGVKFGEEE